MGKKQRGSLRDLNIPPIGSHDLQKETQHLRLALFHQVLDVADRVF
jgi:hypothetical protein